MPELTELDKAATSEPTKVEAAAAGSGSDSDSDDTIPELEDAGAGAPVSFPGSTVAGLPIDMVSKAKQSRGEKKARKLMSKLGLKPVRLFIILSCDFLNYCKIIFLNIYTSEYTKIYISGSRS